MGRFRMNQRAEHTPFTGRKWILCGVAVLAGCAGNMSEPLPGDPSPNAEEVATNQAAVAGFVTDFFDGFDGSSLNGGNWQDQILWVNNELQCYDNGYNEGGNHRTVEVSNGSLKLRVVDAGSTSACNNWDKYGNKHGSTRYRGGRIASKNRKEFAGGRWTARLNLFTWKWSGGFGQASGLSGMFPAWWLLGYRNNEAPVQQSDENVCWPLTGSGEIDIMEHYGNNGSNRFAARGIKSRGYCDGGDWQTYQLGLSSDLSAYHEYQMENAGADLIYRIDGREVGRNRGIGGDYKEPLFAILNYAVNAGMDGSIKEYVMQVDWVRHEKWQY